MVEELTSVLICLHGLRQVACDGRHGVEAIMPGNPQQVRVISLRSFSRSIRTSSSVTCSGSSVRCRNPGHHAPVATKGIF